MSFFLALSTGSPASAELRAGAATADISPDQWPIYLRGSFYKKPAESVHDPLHARTIVLDDGDISGVERLAHAIKGASANVGGDVLRDAAVLLEKISKVGDLDTARTSFTDLEREYIRTKDAMDKKD